jgi:hypothetical protein
MENKAMTIIEKMTEKCSECENYWSPSLVESSLCIFCIQRDTKKKLEATKASLKELYDYQQRISSPDTKWELPIYQRARDLIK